MRDMEKRLSVGTCATQPQTATYAQNYSKNQAILMKSCLIRRENPPMQENEAAELCLEMREVEVHQQFGCLNPPSLQLCLERMTQHNLYKPNLAGNKNRSQ
jgi:hypothetical protein